MNEIQSVVNFASALSSISELLVPNVVLQKFLECLQSLGVAEAELLYYYNDEWHTCCSLARTVSAVNETVVEGLFREGPSSIHTNVTYTRYTRSWDATQLATAVANDETITRSEYTYFSMLEGRELSLAAVVRLHHLTNASNALHLVQIVTHHTRITLQHCITHIELQRQVQQALVLSTQQTTDLNIALGEATSSAADAAAMQATAEKASAIKEQFLASVSHELRTPMNGVVGMVEMLLDSALNNDQREGMLIIKSCADSLLNLVNDVLDLSRVENGEFRLEDKNFTLRDMIESALDVVADAAAEKQLDFAAQIIITAPIVVRGDP